MQSLYKSNAPKRTQMASKETASEINKLVIEKDKLKGAGEFEIHIEESDEILHIDNLQGLHYRRTAFLLIEWNYQCKISLNKNRKG